MDIFKNTFRLLRGSDSLAAFSETEYRQLVSYRRDIQHRIHSMNAGPQIELPELSFDLANAKAYAEKWSDVYATELKTIGFMPLEAIEAEFARRVVEAEKFGLSAAGQIKEKFISAADNVGAKRSLLCVLLDEIHHRYEEAQLSLEARMRATTAINRVGVWMWVLIIGITSICISDPTYMGYAALTWLLPIFAGMNGAYFSRLIDFQSRADILNSTTLDASFSYGGLLLRILAGMIGAILIFIIIQSGLISGSFFPSPGGTSNSTVWQKLAVYGDITLLLPSKSFAGLLFWCTLAGFSERLLPDQFARLAPGKTT